MELSTERPSLLILNEYCLLEIFKFLQLDDSMNLAECCNRLKRIADRAFKMKSTFELNADMFRKGDNYIDRVFTHIGHNVSCLIISCFEIYCDGINPNLSKIISDCNNLKRLQICHWYSGECHIDSTLHNFDKVELVSLYECDLENLKMFLKNFCKLKFLTIRNCPNGDEKLMAALLNNNPEMESLSYLDEGPRNDFHIFQLLERIPKLKRLGLQISRTINTTELNSLLTLSGLTKLELVCNSNSININKILSELARKGIMEEMKLCQIEIDDNFIDIMKSFVRLQLLSICPYDHVKLKSSTIWPTNLQRLQLEKFEFTHLSFISTIQKLKRLEYMDIECCRIAKSDVADFKNMSKLSRNILNVIDRDNRKQRLEVVLPYDSFLGDDSKVTELHIVTSELRNSVLLYPF